MRIFLRFLILTFISLAVTACGQDADQKNQIKVGTISGPETELMEVAKQVAKKRFNLDLKIISFSSYPMPNQALAEGSIDANMFQHLPYLKKDMKAHGYDLVVLGKTFIYPMAIYSQKYKSIAEVPSRAIVAIPNDPSNGARALLLLQRTGLIKLRSGVTHDAVPNDIVDNPKRLAIKSMDAAQLPRVLPDVDLAVINTNWAIPAGLLPKRDGLFLEPSGSDYANIVVIQRARQGDERLKQLLMALHDPAVEEKARVLFRGQAIKAW